MNKLLTILLLNKLSKSSGGGSSYPPNWNEIGYSDTPQNIIDAFDYAKEIYDNWDSTQTNLSNKFNQDLNLIYMPLVDTSNATNMSGFFSGCSNLKDLPLLNTGNVTNMQRMFQGCSLLKTVPLIDTSKVQSLFATFQGCSNLVAIPQLDTHNVTNMFVTFQNCAKLRDVPILNTSKITSIDSAFSNCSSLSNESLNNILAMCINATNYTGTKTLKYIGLTSTQATICQGLSNYQAFLDAGWTTGY